MLKIWLLPVLAVLALAVSGGSGASRSSVATRSPDTAPYWSPEGNWLGFGRGTRTVVTSRTGRGRRYVGAGVTLVWSRDDRRLLIAGPKGIIRVAEGDGSRARLVGRGDVPSWSPDTSFFAFASGTGIVIADRSGRFVRRLEIPRGPNCPEVFCTYNVDDVDWSPAGNTIAFALASFWTASKGTSSLWTIGADGSDLRALPSSYAVSQIRWAPTGDLIAYLQYDEFEDDILHIVDPATGRNARFFKAWRFEWTFHGDMIASVGDSSNPRIGTYVDLVRVADGWHRRLLRASSPSWSPDGDRLLFSRGGWVWVADGLGNHQRRLARGVRPAWSPRGPTIAFAGAACGPRQGIWLLNLINGAPFRITTRCTTVR